MSEYFQISSRTMEILKNFSSIEQRFVVRPGSKIAVRRPNDTLLAIAEVPEEFPSSFGIYQISKFLGIVSIMDEPWFKIEDEFLRIKKGRQLVSYRLTDVDMILNELRVDPYEKINAKLPSVEVDFDIDKDEWKKFKKAVDILKLPQIAIVGDGETVVLQGVDTKKSATDVYSVEVGETSKTFRSVIDRENIVFLDQDYKVRVCTRGMVSFKAPDIEYFVPLTPASTFQKED